MMDLPEFIRSIGVQKAAELFGEKPRTVNAWMYRERTPRPESAQRIVEVTKGKVTFASIYGRAQ